MIAIIILAACLFAFVSGYLVCLFTLSDSTPPREDDYGTLPPPDEPIPYIISEWDSKA